MKTSKTIPYQVATALRGPDASSHGYWLWKSLVTEVFRGFVIEVYGLDENWCQGNVSYNRSIAMNSPSSESELGTAANFAKGSNAIHCVSHARIGFSRLIEDATPEQGKVILRYLKLLKQYGLV